MELEDSSNYIKIDELVDFFNQKENETQKKRSLKDKILGKNKKPKKNRQLSIAKIMEDLKAKNIDPSVLPDAFFNYHSQEEFECSNKVTATGFNPLMWLTINARDPYFYSLLTESSIKEKLLKTVNERNGSSWTALMLAARNANK